MPKRPNNEEIKIIFEMFEASVAGELYDPERFGSYYTPQGVQLNNSPAPRAPQPVVTQTATTEPVAEAATPTEEKVVETETNTADEKPSADQILKMIRDRKSHADH